MNVVMILGGDDVLLYWLKKAHSKYEPVFIGEIRTLDIDEIKRAFDKKGVQFTRITGFAVIKQAGNALAMELYENGTGRLTQRIQEWKAYTLADMFRFARKYLSKKEGDVNG